VEADVRGRADLANVLVAEEGRAGDVAGAVAVRLVRARAGRVGGQRLLVVVAVAGDVVGARHRRKLDAAEVDGEVRVFGEAVVAAELHGVRELAPVARVLVEADGALVLADAPAAAELVGAAQAARDGVVRAAVAVLVKRRRVAAGGPRPHNIARGGGRALVLVEQSASTRTRRSQRRRTRRTATGIPPRPSR
jgi:hypothetical protein